MKVAILAGDKTSNVVNLLKAKSNFTLYFNDNIEMGLSDVMLRSDIDKVVLFDTTFLRNGKELNYVEVFNALRQVGSAKPDIEIILISKSRKLFDVGLKAMSSTYNFRASLVESLSSQKIIDIILNKVKEYSEVLEEEKNLDNLTIGIKGDAETTSIESQDDECVSGEVQGSYTEPEPVNTVEPKPAKKRPSLKLNLGSKKNLLDILTSRKVVIVTGNHNSGVTNLCCELAYATSVSGAKTLLLDADIFYHGVNMYFADLDSGNCEACARTGLLMGLRDLDTLDECVHEVYPNLHILGTRSDIPYEKFNGLMEDDSYLSDIVHTLTVDYDVLYIHLPIELLCKYSELVKISTEIVYASNCTINGIYSINRYLTTSDSSLSRLMILINRKLKLVLTNYNNPKTINSSNFCEVLSNVSNGSRAAKGICGVVNYQKDFDEFTHTKKLYSRDGKEMNNIVDIAYNILN